MQESKWRGGRAGPSRDRAGGDRAGAKHWRKWGIEFDAGRVAAGNQRALAKEFFDDVAPLLGVDVAERGRGLAHRVGLRRRHLPEQRLGIRGVEQIQQDRGFAKISLGSAHRLNLSFQSRFEARWPRRPDPGEPGRPTRARGSAATGSARRNPPGRGPWRPPLAGRLRPRETAALPVLARRRRRAPGKSVLARNAAQRVQQRPTAPGRAAANSPAARPGPGLRRRGWRRRPSRGDRSS